MERYSGITPELTDQQKMDKIKMLKQLIEDFKWLIREYPKSPYYPKLLSGLEKDLAELANTVFIRK